MLLSKEKQGGKEFNNAEVDIFRDAVATCNLEDMAYVGHDFTWSNNRGGDQNIQERLDRFLATTSWKAIFSGSVVFHLAKRKLDHLTLLLNIKGEMRTSKKKKRKCLFKFKEMWLRDEECGQVVEDAWHGAGDVCEKISQASNRLTNWGREKFGDFMKEMKACKNRMEMLMG
ncbi:Phosphatidylinositol 3-kinase 3 [Bienertia sinuspersici]